MPRDILALMLALATVACGDGDRAPVSEVGHYVLVRADGMPLPSMTHVDETDTIVHLSGSVDLSEGGTAELALRWWSTFSGSGRDTTDVHYAGEYEREGSDVIWTMLVNGEPVHDTISYANGALTLEDTGHTLRFERE